MTIAQTTKNSWVFSDEEHESSAINHVAAETAAHGLQPSLNTERHARLKRWMTAALAGTVSLFGASLLSSTAALAATRDHAATHSPYYVSVEVGHESSQFKSEKFERGVTDYAPNATSWTNRNTDYDATIGRLALGRQFHKTWDMEVGLWTPYSNRFESDFTNTVSSTVIYKNKIQKIDFLMGPHYMVPNTPVSLFLKGGVAIANMETTFTETTVLGANGEKTIDRYFLLPTFKIGATYHPGQNKKIGIDMSAGYTFHQYKKDSASIPFAAARDRRPIHGFPATYNITAGVHYFFS